MVNASRNLQATYLVLLFARVFEDMPLYDILNEFQKGHSHMAVVVKQSTPAELQKIENAGGDVKLEIIDKPNNDKPEEKIVKVKMPLQKWKSYPSGMQREGSLRGSRKWSKAAMADVLEINDKALPKLNEDEEAIGIITMEDVIEELLQEEIFDETDYHEDQENSALPQ